MRVKHTGQRQLPKQHVAAKVLAVFDPLPRKATLRNKITRKVIRVSAATLDGLFRVIKTHPGYDVLS